MTRTTGKLSRYASFHSRPSVTDQGLREVARTVVSRTATLPSLHRVTQQAPTRRLVARVNTESLAITRQMGDRVASTGGCRPKRGRRRVNPVSLEREVPC